MPNKNTYSAEALEWFDANWEAGVAHEKICVGMAARGYEMDPKKATHLASRRSLYRPPGYAHANKSNLSTRVMEDLQRKSLLTERKILQDNQVVKPDRKFHYEGGYSMFRQ